jgi:hypothetical protein
MNTMYLDNYLDYSIVVESMAEPNQGFELLQEGKSRDGSLSFLRFRACLQTFSDRNRNRRRWYAKWTRPMFESPEVKELLREGGVPGEAGHPVPPTGEVTIERILTIDPNNISHVIKEYIWPSENRVDGIIETLDDGNGPGDKFKRHILQGLPVSFSTRSIIPQRKNPDGTIDQTGPGRYVTSDHVFLPSHKDAYIDKTIPVKNVCKPDRFETVMESFVSFVSERSDKVNRIVDGMTPAMESASMGADGMISIPTKEGVVGIYPELKYRREFADIMKNL